LDVAFNVCVRGIDGWVDEHIVRLSDLGTDKVTMLSPLGPSELCLLVVDDTSDQGLKHALKSSFRSLRVRARGLRQLESDRRVWHLHDDMYFGDSKDSVGIQIADLCNYFMMRKLRGENDEFFELLEPYAICATPEPEFSQCKPWLMRHDVD
jgi:hypothetical protein